MQKIRLLTGLLLIAIVIIGLFGAAKAFFSRMALSSDNTITSGTMEFNLSDNDESQLEAITGSWVGSDLTPGDSMAEQSILIKNAGIINGDHLKMTVAYTGSEDLAKSILLMGNNNGFRYGNTPAGAESIDLIAALLGNSDPDYQVIDPETGEPLTSIDGADGSVADNQVSLSELNAAGTFIIAPQEEFDGILAGTESTLWINAIIDEGLTEQGAEVDVTITFELEQEPLGGGGT